MATLQQLKDRLERAEEAYDALMIGGSARVVVDSNGERVEYSAANAARLQAYIESLKWQIANFGKTPSRGPAGVLF